jgi:hypothetical protein
MAGPWCREMGDKKPRCREIGNGVFVVRRRGYFIFASLAFAFSATGLVGKSFTTF